MNRKSCSIKLPPCVMKPLVALDVPGGLKPGGLKPGKTPGSNTANRKLVRLDSITSSDSRRPQSVQLPPIHSPSGARAETEMEKLQRQFGIMERDRQACSVQSQEEIRKQRQEISRLRVDHEGFLRELECRSRRRNGNRDAERIQTQLDQRNTVEVQLEKERRTQTQMEQEIMNMEKKLVEASQSQACQTPRAKHTLQKKLAEASQSQACQIQKATHTQQNKLDWALIRYNERLTKNSQLRKELETLHMQRARFQQLHGRLEKVLHDVRKDIGVVMDEATTAYDDREDAQSQITLMKEDIADISAEIKELKRTISHEHQLKKFMTTKNKERTAMDGGRDKLRRQEMEEQRRAAAVEETFDPLEEVLQEIQRLTGEDNLKMLATHFTQAEEKNFSLFNFVNEQNMEAETAREQIQENTEEMKQMHMKHVQKEQKNQVALKELMDVHQDFETQAQQYEAQVDDIRKILHQIKTGTDSVFKKIDCDRKQVLDMLGYSSRIRDSNIMKYLSLLEQRTSELLIIQAFINSKDRKKSCDLKEVAQFLLGRKPDVLRHTEILQERPLRPITRFRRDYEAEDCFLTDEKDRILTHKELRQLALRSVMHKESLRAGGGKDVKTLKSRIMSSSRQCLLKA